MTYDDIRVAQDSVSEVFRMALRYEKAQDAMGALSPETLKVVMDDLISTNNAYLFSIAFPEATEVYLKHLLTINYHRAKKENES